MPPHQMAPTPNGYYQPPPGQMYYGAGPVYYRQGQYPGMIGMHSHGYINSGFMMQQPQNIGLLGGYMGHQQYTQPESQFYPNYCNQMQPHHPSPLPPQPDNYTRNSSMLNSHSSPNSNLHLQQQNYDKENKEFENELIKRRENNENRRDNLTKKYVDKVEAINENLTKIVADINNKPRDIYNTAQNSIKKENKNNNYITPPDRTILEKNTNSGEDCAKQKTGQTEFFTATQKSLKSSLLKTNQSEIKEEDELEELNHDNDVKVQCKIKESHHKKMACIEDERLIKPLVKKSMAFEIELSNKKNPEQEIENVENLALLQKTRGSIISNNKVDDFKVKVKAFTEKIDNLEAGSARNNNVSLADAFIKNCPNLRAQLDQNTQERTLHNRNKDESDYNQPMDKNK